MASMNIMSTSEIKSAYGTLLSRPLIGAPDKPSQCNRGDEASAIRRRPIRMLRLSQVRAMTGLGKTKIYELQSMGNFPRRIQLTTRSVAWIEEEIQAWLARRIVGSRPLDPP
jgi:prophage regulatory protein